MTKEEIKTNFETSFKLLKTVFPDLNLGNNVCCPFHSQDKNHKNFSIYKTDTGRLLGKCYGDCDKNYNIFELLKVYGNFDDTQLDNFLLSNGIISDELELYSAYSIIKYLFNVQEKNIDIIKNYIFIQKTLSERKISFECLYKYNLLYNYEGIKKYLKDEQIEIIIPKDSQKLINLPYEEYVDKLFQKATITSPLIDINNNFIGFSFCHPLSQKEFRYKHKKFYDNPVYLYEDRITNKDRELFITEGLFSNLCLSDAGYRTISTLGSGFDKDFTHLNDILSKFPLINIIYLAFDLDNVGINKTYKFIKGINKDINIRVFFPCNSKYKSIDDFINNENINKSKIKEYFNITGQTFICHYEIKNFGKKIERSIIENSKTYKYINTLTELFSIMDEYRNNKEIQNEITNKVKNLSKYIYIEETENLSNSLINIGLDIKNKNCILTELDYYDIVNKINKLINER